VSRSLPSSSAGGSFPQLNVTPGSGSVGGADAASPAARPWHQSARSIRTRLLLTLAGFGSLAVATTILAPLVGSTSISLARVFDRSIPFDQNVDAQIFFVARLPRVIAAAIVGATLASAGVVFQALLRNPLATPFTLGVSAGASLGAMLAIIFGASFALGPLSPVPVASFIGAALATGLVYWLATRTGRAISTSVLLLAGVTLNSFFSALIMFVQYLADFAQVYRAARWLMGDLDVGGFDPILTALPLVVVSFALFALLPASLNLLSIGPEAAASRGVDVGRSQRLAFFSASLATSAAVSLAGPIGFIGIVVPHLVRLMVGVDHRIVLPASALFGASFLVACDVAARMLLAPIEIPVGVVTAIIGGPFFLWLLVRKG
jgi:iron complex transport system permease protein